MPVNPDDLTPSLVEEAAKRVPPERDELIRRGEVLVQQDGDGPQQPEQKPDEKTQAVQATLRHSDPTVMGETAKALAGGVRDAGAEVLSFVDDSANWLNDNFMNLRTSSQQAAYDRGERPSLPQVPENETTAGKI